MTGPAERGGLPAGPLGVLGILSSVLAGPGPATADVMAGIGGLVAELAGLADGEVTPDMRLNALGLDSLSRAEIAVSAEETYGIAISDEQMARMETVKDVAAFVGSGRSGRARRDGAAGMPARPGGYLPGTAGGVARGEPNALRAGPGRVD